MPELPEAETLKRQLRQAVEGQKIAKVIVNRSQVIRGSGPDKFKKGLEGENIKHVFRKGKALVFELSSGSDLVIQLGMTGQLIYPGTAKNSRVSLVLDNGKILDYNDNRMFGGLSLLDDWQNLNYFKNLGPEPFDLSVKQFKEMLAAKKTKIKLLLMDQQFISGVGNIYANEALFRAGIDPSRPANSLSDREKEALFEEVKNSLHEAVKHGGSSVDDYVQLDGKKGGYVPHLQIYGREKEKCLKCSGVVKKITLGGRGTYVCQGCQK